MDLDFNACFTLLIIGFVFSLLSLRCLLAIVNRGFLLVDYAQEKLYGKEGKKTGPLNLMQMGWEVLGPMAKQKAQEWMGVKPK